MTPQKEKALKLFNHFYDSFKKVFAFPKEQAKKEALFVVSTHIYNENDSPFPTMKSWIKNDNFWNEIKEEIEKL